MKAPGDMTIMLPLKNGVQVAWWKVSKLWESAQDLPVKLQTLEAFSFTLDQPIKGKFRDRSPTLRELLEQTKRINEADLSYPIILGPNNRILDGRHRLAKAFMDGISEISTVQFTGLPEPDGIMDIKDLDPRDRPS